MNSSRVRSLSANITQEHDQLDIIIVNWNTRDLLYACLKSLYDNKYPQFSLRVFVVDNGSYDDSVSMVCNDFPDVEIIQNSENVGFAAANNQALLLATSRYILLLNSDTLIHGDVFQESCQYLDAHPQIGVLGCRVLNDDGTTQVSAWPFPSLAWLFLQLTGLDGIKWPWPIGHYDLTRLPEKDGLDVDVVSGCAMFVRRAAIVDIGVLDESFFFYAEETDWCRRFREASWRVVYAPTGEITHFGGGSAWSLNYKRDMMLTSAIIMLHKKHGGLSAAICAYVILFLFAVSRAIYWSLYSLLSHNEQARKRRNHFASIIIRYARTWPETQTYHP